MRCACFLLALLVFSVGDRSAVAQFVDTFEDERLAGWETQTGDGAAVTSLDGASGHALVTVDATEDRNNIWWAIFRRDVSGSIDLNRLRSPDAELRVTARIRVSHAPRRVNLSVNTQRTTDYHENLMEFDIPDTTQWHTISMVTDGFDARPGDTVNAQLAMIDWGLQRYRTLVDSFAVEVVPASEAGATTGRAVPYPLPIRSPATLHHHVPVAEAGLVNRSHPDVVLADWHTGTDTAATPTWTVTTNQYLLFRWAPGELPEGSVSGPGVLELRYHSVHRAETTPEELGEIRLVEITGGERAWRDTSLTYAQFVEDQPLDEILNPQPIIDMELSGSSGAVIHFPVSEPVLRRLKSGETTGLALRPVGPVAASFLAGSDDRPVLHFDTKPSP